MTESLNIYLKSIAEITKRGDAREESYYADLKTLLTASTPKHIAVTILPRQTEGGNPDFRVWDGRQHVTGYIEAKIPGTNLDHIEQTD